MYKYHFYPKRVLKMVFQAFSFWQSELRDRVVISILQELIFSAPSSLYGSGYNQVQYGKPPTSTDPTYGGYTSTDYSSGYGNPTYGGYTSMYGNPTYTSYGSYSHSGYGYQPHRYGLTC